MSTLIQTWFTFTTTWRILLELRLFSNARPTYSNIWSITEQSKHVFTQLDNGYMSLGRVVITAAANRWRWPWYSNAENNLIAIAVYHNDPVITTAIVILRCQRPRKVSLRSKQIWEKNIKRINQWHYLRRYVQRSRGISNTWHTERQRLGQQDIPLFDVWYGVWGVIPSVFHVFYVRM